MKGEKSFSGLIVGFIGVSFIISSLVFASPQKATIKDILDNPDKYDQKEVIVEGKVEKIKLTVSKKDNPYTTFNLIDDDYNGIKVFIWGHQEIKNKGIKNNEKVEVIGTFQKVKYVGKYRFYNEIEAESIKKLKTEESEKEEGVIEGINF